MSLAGDDRLEIADQYGIGQKIDPVWIAESGREHFDFVCDPVAVRIPKHADIAGSFNSNLCFATA